MPGAWGQKTSEMFVNLKYVSLDATRPAMELRVNVPEKRLGKPVSSLVGVVEKAYGKRHGGVAFDEGCEVYRDGVRVSGASRCADALCAEDDLVIRARRRKSAAESAPGPVPVPATSPPEARKRRRKLVRINVIADPN